jgi:hypothetical protein
MHSSKQIGLRSIAFLKSGFPRMNSYQPRKTRTVLMVASTQRQDHLVRPRLCAPVDVVDADIRRIVSIHATRNAA